MKTSEAHTEMIERQLAARGIASPTVLAAFREVPREAFVRPELAEFAYTDSPLPIAEGQTISQPYIVALTVEALDLQGGERVLEIGTGSGYAAAILGQVAREVHSVERLGSLVETATQRLAAHGSSNVHVHHGDGTLGWAEHAPYDAIAVAAGGPTIPTALLSQLAPGGRLVIPVGPDVNSQVLLRVTREGDSFREEDLGAVRFVPLVGEQGFAPERRPKPAASGARPVRPEIVATLVREVAEPLTDVDRTVAALLERVGDARLVLLGESTHGTHEFYAMRARITQELVRRKRFDFVAVEADWPDAARIDEYVLGAGRRSRLEFTPFARFPTWMWRNREVETFVSWLRDHNLAQPDPLDRVGFHGLDLYSMFTSIAAVLSYLHDVDPAAAQVARGRYGALTPWQKDPAAYGRAVLMGRYESSETSVVAMLRDMLKHRLDYASNDGERFFDATQNARLVADAERYYRAMYYSSAASWNLRDTHMFDTLQALMAFYGPNARGIVWAHNSHVGNALATEMSARGELNVGQLCRSAYGEDAYVVGFSTDHGAVAAAAAWGEPMQRMRVRPGHAESYERIFHDSGVPAFALHLREPRRRAVRDELLAARLERAIGVVYRPQTELASHYFQAALPRQFDELVWFDETRATTPLPAPQPAGADQPETYPWGL